MKDYLKERRQKWNTTKMNEDQNERRPLYINTTPNLKNEDDLTYKMKTT